MTQIIEVGRRVDRYEREAVERLRYCACYVIGPDADGPVKVGVATDVVKRHSGMQVGCWTRLFVFDLLWFAGPPLALRVEAKALASLRATGIHLRGEWFNESATTARAHLRLAAQGLGLHWFDEAERRRRVGVFQTKQIDELLAGRIL